MRARQKTHVAVLAGAAFISLVITVMAGCASAGPAEGPAANVGTMLVRVEWPEASAELVPAASQSVEVIVTATEAGTTAATRVLTPASPTALIENLEAGISYTVSASAYPESDASGTAQATGTTTKTIVADQVNTVNLSMASTITSVSASPSPSSMEVGGSVTLTPQATNNEGTTVLVGDTWTFSSDKTGVATVNAAGQVSGVAEGAAGITVTESESGVSAEVLVLVIGSEIVW
ncbi:MAG: hypothetical protein GF320_06535, partial [Armatimonadia bacterium]|nr:hypothetical protein [Armatimonadia bacterium]